MEIRMQLEKNKKVVADKETFLMIIDILNELQIRYWVEGGWGIDVLVGKQTREHRDIDIDFDINFETKLMNKLEEIGYLVTTNCYPTRVELFHPKYGYIDVHPFIITKNGNMKQANPEGGWFNLEAKWFTESIFEGRIIPYISVEGQKLFHSGYELREVDKRDMETLNNYF